jgi:hypothetical protein
LEELMASARTPMRCAVDLVAHQGQERRDEQGASRSRVPEQACGQEIDAAFSPAGALDDQQALAMHEALNRFPLVGMEVGGW